MLTLTPNASTIVKQITTQPGFPDSAGLRISSENPAESSFSVSTAPEAEPGDQVVDQDGATVFLDEASAGMLDDKILDAAVDSEGKVEFALAMQG